MRTKRSRFPALFISLLVFLPGLSAATTVSPGFDLFATDPDLTYVDLGFGPIHLQGVPLSDQGGLFSGLGNTDTIIERMMGLDTLPGTVEIELVALHLVSVAPIDIGGTLFDLEIVSGSLMGEPSNIHGTMTINADGSFEAALPVNALITITDIENPSNSFSKPFFDTFTSVGLWCGSEPPGAMSPHNGAFPAGGFFPGYDCLTGVKLPMIEVAAFARHGVLPAMPIPASVWLLFSSILGILGLSRRRLRSRQGPE